MNRRRFQFSLRAALVTTLLVAVGMGAYIRLPYYYAGKALDQAAGDKSFPAWPVVRDALIYSESFRDDALRGHVYLVEYNSRRSIPGRAYVNVFRDEKHVLTRSWFLVAEEINGHWTAMQ